MSTLPPPFDPSDDADEQYRRASELDPSRPSETTRRAVLAHAARLAAERARRDRLRRWLSLMGATLRGRPAIAGTIAAAILAGVVIAPQFLAPTAPPASQRAPAMAPPQAAIAPATAPPAPRTPEERASLPAPVEPASPAGPAVTLQRARVPSGGAHAALRESASADAASAAPASARAGSEALTALQLEQRADAGTASALAPVAAASRVAPARRPVSAPAVVSAGPDALRQAAAAGDLAALKGALASASDIDARDAQGRTALMLATLNGETNAVAVLLAHGADPSGSDAHGTTPLQAAVAADEREIIALLRRYGAR